MIISHILTIFRILASKWKCSVLIKIFQFWDLTLYMKIHLVYHSFILYEYLLGSWTLYNKGKMSFQIYSCDLHKFQIISPLNTIRMEGSYRLLKGQHVLRPITMTPVQLSVLIFLHFCPCSLWSDTASLQHSPAISLSRSENSLGVLLQSKGFLKKFLTH